jgi:NTE family protein
MTVLTLWRRSRRAEQPESHLRPREAFVLSGGGSLGAAQVGAMRALLEAGVVPDVVVGCSVGSLNAAFLAVDPTLERVADLEDVWLRMRRDDVFPDGRFSVGRRLVSRDSHLYSPEGLRALIRRCVPLDDLAGTAIPVHVVTTDLRKGEPAWWTGGDPVDVLAASACLPAMFPPVDLGGSLHVDGGVSCPVPTQRAVDLGAARVWVLDVSRDFHPFDGERMSALDVLLESFAVSRARIAQTRPTVAPDQRVVTLPSLGVGRHDLRDFSRTPALLAAGLVAGRRMVADELAAARSAERTVQPAHQLAAAPAS